VKKSDEIEELCKKLKPVLGENAKELWYTYLAEDEKGRRELALEIEIVAEKLLKKAALENQKILLSPPSKEDSSGSILLGDVIYNEQIRHQLFLKPEDFIKQIGIFAITGEGKTNLAYLLSLQLLKEKTPFLVIDWKRSWRNLLSLKDRFPELKQVQVYTIGRDVIPFSWNPFRQPPDADGQLWISTIAESLEKSHLSGPGVAYYFNRIYMKYAKSLTNDFYPNFFDGTKEIESIKAYERELKWKQTALRIFQSFTTGCSSKVFNARNPVKLENLLDQPVILELDLEMPKPLRIFFTEIILRWIHLFRLSQGETDSLRHVLFLEEVHNLFTQSAFLKETSHSLENVYREIRAFGQGVVSITQHPSLLPVYLLGNCHTQIYLGLQHADDIRTARKSLFLGYSEEPYLNMLKIGECITKVKNRIEPCLVKTPLVPVKKGLVSDEWLKAHQFSFLMWKYCWNNDDTDPKYLSFMRNINKILANDNSKDSVQTDETQIPQKLNTQGCLKDQLKQNTQFSPFHSKKKNQNEDEKTSDISRPEKNKYPVNVSCDRLLVDIYLHPYSSVTRRYKRLKLNSNYGNNLRKKLVERKYTQPRKIITSKGWITLFDLTHKGRLTLRDFGYDARNVREGIIHRFWKNKLADYYEKKNMTVMIEEPINGRADIVVIDKAQNKKIAVEIETGKSYAVYNIQRALKAGFDEVISVATDRFVRDKIKNELKKRDIEDERLKVMAVQEIV
jgi:hypothetical protein